MSFNFDIPANPLSHLEFLSAGMAWGFTSRFFDQAEWKTLSAKHRRRLMKVTSGLLVRFHLFCWIYC